MSLEYDYYLEEHIRNVRNSLHWMRDNLDLDQKMKDTIDETIISADHDRSKYSRVEYNAYDAYFYRGNRSHQVVTAFDYAWLWHIHHNPHHWQYWVLLEDDPKTGEKFKPLEMPEPIVFEMISDWWSFSWKDGNLYEIFDWYDEHKDKMILHPKTRKLVMDILHAIYMKLEETDLKIEHSDTEEEDKHKYGVPEQKKFPLPDAAHVRSAIRFFNYVEPKYEEKLAKAILARAEEYGIDISEINVGDENRFKKYLPEDHLEHHGILGMKWGQRRYQNPDGSLTEEGKQRYRKTVFVSGSSKTQTEDSPYYRKELPKEIKTELDKHIKNNDKIIVGDAPGIDRQVQDYLNEKDYDSVEVYGPGKQVRYSANEKWKTNPIDAPEYEEGSKEWLAKKDIAMSKAADEGLSVILDEGAKATRENVKRLMLDNKDVKVFELSKNGEDDDGWNNTNQLAAENLKHTKSKNVDQWGESEDTNVLYITGAAGSGKSTVAQALESDKVNVIHLDSYFDYQDPNNSSFNNHLDKNLPNWRNLSAPKDEISLNDWGRLCAKFEKEIENYGKEQHKEGKKVVVEGVHLLDDTLRPEKSFFADKPIIIMETNALASAKRANERDEIPLSVGEVKRIAHNTKSARREMNALEKEIGATKTKLDYSDLIKEKEKNNG